MLTKKDCIAVGAAVCQAAREVGGDSNTTEVQRHLVRGTCLHALYIIWTKTLNDRAKALFGSSYQNYLDECGWPK